ncbi:MAG: uncharacterized protein PWQ82_258 [Thermosediminibacterales bacterium]|nr:uncharacterized protein [Thermosediminibacterales bacterium]MDK2835281.1 uncharacterized protein [Thermosediminibacterales bacterium]
METKIHKFSIDNTKIVLDVNSGAVFVVDDLMFDVLDFYDNTPREQIKNKLKGKYKSIEIDEAVEELDKLKRDGVLFTGYNYKAAAEKIRARSEMKALCLNIAHDCNLRCKYCFASDGNYKGEKGLMPPEVGKKAVDFLIQKSGDIKKLEIDFFGGEPLLNFETVKEVVAYARNIESKYEKEFHFTITTNATLLDDEIINYLHENMDNIVLSLDGRREVHDRMRVRADGSGTYDTIISNIKKVVALREKDKKDYFVRGTFTKHNLDFSQDVIHMADNGFEQISIEPVVGKDIKEYMFTESDLPVIYNEYEKLAKEYLERRKTGRNPFRFYHFNIDLYNGPCIYKRLVACGSGREYLAVTPNGDIYPCHQFVGNSEFVIGNVYDKKLNDFIINQFRETDVYSKQDCSSCWARFFCSGGCNANNFNFNGDIKKPYELNCKLQKKRIECAIYINIKEIENSTLERL